MEANHEQLSVNLDVKLVQEIKTYCEVYGLDENDLIQDAIHEFMATRQARLITSLTAMSKWPILIVKSPLNSTLVKVRLMPAFAQLIYPNWRDRSGRIDTTR